MTGLAPTHCLIHPESVNKSAFVSYLAEVLLPHLAPDSILVMDNWTVHHGEDVTKLVESHGCSILYLPTYSPDFNPIEYLFSKIKNLVKKLRPLAMIDLIQTLVDATLSVTPQDALNSFRHCGYLWQRGVE